MKKMCLVLFLLFALPTMAQAVSSSASPDANARGTVSPDATVSSTGEDTSQTRSENQVRTQTSNPGVGVMTQEQREEKVQQDLAANKSEYAPKNENAVAHRSVVANAVEELIRTASRVENQGIGDQIRLVAQTQTKNQDKIAESVDKADSRSEFAKFFIGANFGELKEAKKILNENKNQIKQLEQVMAQMVSDEDKVAVANQIIVLQQTQLELFDQIEGMTEGFSLFGWINRWFSKY